MNEDLHQGAGLQDTFQTITPRRVTVTFGRDRQIHPHNLLREKDERYDDIVGWHLDSVAGYYFLTHVDGWIAGVPLEGRHVLITPQ